MEPNFRGRSAIAGQLHQCRSALDIPVREGHADRTKSMVPGISLRGSQGELVTQQKYHSGSSWSESCVSTPADVAPRRRLLLVLLLHRRERLHARAAAEARALRGDARAHRPHGPRAPAGCGRLGERGRVSFRCSGTVQEVRWRGKCSTSGLELLCPERSKLHLQYTALNGVQIQLYCCE